MVVKIKESLVIVVIYHSLYSLSFFLISDDIRTYMEMLVWVLAVIFAYPKFFIIPHMLVIMLINYMINTYLRYLLIGIVFLASLNLFFILTSADVIPISIKFIMGINLGYEFSRITNIAFLIAYTITIISDKILWRMSKRMSNSTTYL